MANDKPQKSKSDQADGAKKAPAKPSRERPFDMWLQKQLHSMYDEIAAEPVPDDLLNLIDTDAADKANKK